MKVGEGGVQCNIYDGYYTQQWIRIPKATWTLPSLEIKSTYRTSSSKVFFMKDYLNDEVFNGTPKTLILSNGVLNQDEVSMSGNKPQGDHATHFKSWIERLIAQSLV